MATTNDIKNGSVLSLDGQLWTVVDFQHVKPGKGGAFVRLLKGSRPHPKTTLCLLVQFSILHFALRPPPDWVVE